jgi:hypothetical protein
MFEDFEDRFNISKDEETTETKTFELESYADYMAHENKNKKKETVKPKELNDDLLKILVYKTNKEDIKRRPLQEQNIIPAHPFRLILNGRSGSGKSMNLINMLTRPHFYGRTDKKDPKSGYFDLVFLFSPTAEGGDDLTDHLDLPTNRIITDEDLFFPQLDHILKIQKGIIEKNGLLKSPKILLIFDDCQSAQKFLNSPNFIKIFIAGRHYNISSIACGQSWTKFPRAVRLQASNIMLYPSSGSEVDLLTEEYTPPNKSKSDMRRLVAHATAEPFNFLHINNQVPIKDRYRKNLDTVLNID